MNEKVKWDQSIIFFQYFSTFFRRSNIFKWATLRIQRKIQETEKILGKQAGGVAAGKWVLVWNKEKEVRGWSRISKTGTRPLQSGVKTSTSTMVKCTDIIWRHLWMWGVWWTFWLLFLTNEPSVVNSKFEKTDEFTKHALLLNHQVMPAKHRIKDFVSDAFARLQTNCKMKKNVFSFNLENAFICIVDAFKWHFIWS